MPTCDWTCLAVITPTTAELATASALERQLDPGEAECLAVALQRGYRFLSDDFAARRLAKAKGITVSGTIGILKKVRAHAKPRVRSDKMQEKQLRSPKRI